MDNNTSHEYRTGGHLPKKSSGGLLAAALLIFLAVTGMFFTAGFMTLRSFSFDREQELAALQPPEYTRFPGEYLHMEGEVENCSIVGITCQGISTFCQQYYELPEGVYITQVTKGSPADRHGVLPGDVLVRANGEALRHPSALQKFFNNPANPNPVKLEFFRKGNIYTIFISPGA